MRKARERAESGVYQILLKGNNRLLFVDDCDYQKFLEILEGVAARDFMEVYAYCLFAEEINLALKEGLIEFSRSMRDIISAYAIWFNGKYCQSGKLFYDRFLSLGIETDGLKPLVRHIHGLAREKNKPQTYEYSSYGNYIKKTGLRSDTVMLLYNNSVAEYKLGMDEDDDGEFLGAKTKKLTDDELVDKIREIASGVDIKTMTSEDFKKILREIKQIEGASVRQIARLLGVSKSTVGSA